MPNCESDLQPMQEPFRITLHEKTKKTNNNNYDTDNDNDNDNL